MPQRIVLHLHMLDAVIHAALPDAQERLNPLLAGLAWRLLPYARPGLPLSRLVQEILEGGGPPPDVLILKNHGVIVAADDEETAIRLVNELVRHLWLPPRPLLVPNIPALIACNDAGLRIPVAPYPHALAFGPVAAALCRNNPLCPDQAVFLGPAVCTLRPHEHAGAALRRFAGTYGCEAPCVVVPECGVLFSPQINAGAEAMIEALAHVAMRAPQDAELEYLPDDCLAELASWEAEQWRKKLDRPASAADVR
jgi:rhamnose utilization protein RhaD (predicted bifunctional aldolase and dehydrogenase)